MRARSKAFVLFYDPPQPDLELGRPRRRYVCLRDLITANRGAFVWTESPIDAYLVASQKLAHALEDAIAALHPECAGLLQFGTYDAQVDYGCATGSVTVAVPERSGFLRRRRPTIR